MSTASATCSGAISGNPRASSSSRSSGGTIVAVGYAGGWWEELSPALLVGRNVGIQGFYLGRLTERRPEIVKAAADDLLHLWSQGAIRPVVGAGFPLDQAAAAHTLIEERRHVAKVVLVP